MKYVSKVAIIGTGKIGTDLLAKILKSTDIKCLVFIGRRKESSGVKFALKNGVPVVLDGYKVLEAMREKVDWVIDATSAMGHRAMINDLKDWHYNVIDMTPSGLGTPYSPLIDFSFHNQNTPAHVNLMTCGAQVCSPFVHVIGALAEIEYIESVANLSSDSVGAATRINIDEYITTTEKALCDFSGARQSKAILVINPAVPPITMKVTIFIKFTGPGPTLDMREKIITSLEQELERFQEVIPGMEFPHIPNFEGQILKIDVIVSGNGDYLPKHSGNLDVLTSSALWLITVSKKRVV